MSAKSFAFPTLVLLGISLVVLPAPRPVQACGMAYGQGFEPRVADETALIVYDSATQTEHFLRLAKFDGASADFGFFVPTPSQPELAEGSSDIFPMLAKLTEPVIVHRTIKQEPSFACGGVGASRIPGSIDAMPAGIRVIEKKRIGAFDAAVLKAEDARVLQDWLKENEYSTRPALEAWFGEYIRLGWFITAFKIAGGTSMTPSVNTPVRISFKTDVPVYPYREPLDVQAHKDSWRPRLLRLFVLSDARVAGSVGRDGKAFAGQTVWSKPVATNVIAPALATGKFPAMNRDWHLTEFEDASAPRRDLDDVYFSKSSIQDLVERPPHEIVTVETTYWRTGLCCSGVALVPILIFLGGLRLALTLMRKGDLRRTAEKSEPPAEMPTVVALFRRLCLLFAIAGAVGIPCSFIALTDLVHRDPDLKFREFVGFFSLAVGVCIAYGLPLRVTPNRPWLYWYSLALILILAASCYGTVLTIGFLAFWLRHSTRSYFGQVWTSPVGK